MRKTTSLLTTILIGSLLLTAGHSAMAENEWRVKFTISIDKTDYLEGEPILMIASATNVSDDPMRFEGVSVDNSPTGPCYLTAVGDNEKIYAPLVATSGNAPANSDPTMRVAPHETIVGPTELTVFTQVSAEGELLIVDDPKTGRRDAAYIGPLPSGRCTMHALSTQWMWIPMEIAKTITEPIVAGRLKSNTVRFTVHPKGTKLRPELTVKVVGKPIPPDQKTFSFMGQVYIAAEALAPLQVKTGYRDERVEVTRGDRKAFLPTYCWTKTKQGQLGILPYLWGCLPIRQVASALGLRLAWDPKSKTLCISAPKS